MLLDIKGNPLADYINGICEEVGVNPIDDVFAESDLREKGFSIRYNELLAFAVVHNWDPAYNRNAKTILKSKKKFNQFLRGVNLLEGTAPKDVLIEYLRLVKVFFKHELIITNFLESQRIYLTIENIINSDLPTCIFGETGTEKEFVANIIHKLSKLKSDKGKFIVLNCAGIPDYLLHKEVFGYAKSTFPGATEDHEGYLAKADGGTLFLDEIGDSGELFQKAMLRFLNDGSYNMLGDPLERKSKCRIICTTKSKIQNFQKEIKDKVRSDFYHRITGHIIYLPPLRHVRSNIPLLILLYTLATCKRFNFKDTVVYPSILLKFWITEEKWKGNYRQLKNSVEDYVTKFIHLERKGGYKIDRPFYNLTPLSGKWFEKNPLYILKPSKKEYMAYDRLWNTVDGYAILPFLKKLFPKDPWNFKIIVDLLHMVTNPYLHYALFRFNEKMNKCDYNKKLYNRYTNFRFTTGHEDLDDPSVKSDSSIKVKLPRKRPNEKLKTKKTSDKKAKYPIEKYSSIEVKINDDGIAENKIRLIPKTGSGVPERTIKFLNVSTKEFIFILFLIYERESGERFWLQRLKHSIKKRDELYPKFIDVLKWCGLHEKDIGESTEYVWWHQPDKRRELKRQISIKGHKVGLIGNIVMNAEWRGKGGSYELNPCFTNASIIRS